eukprot:gene21157-27412_t
MSLNLIYGLLIVTNTTSDSIGYFTTVNITDNNSSITTYTPIIESNKSQDSLIEESFNGYDLSIAKKQAIGLLNLIYHRYELNGTGAQFFRTANNFASYQWDKVKYKFMKKMLQGNQTFLMIFGGSSVTAGHDNYFNQSFPMIVLKRMKPILKALGIKMKVHNIAQGANNCIPYSFCYESMGGINPDFVGWEQSYNCGHDDPIFELVGRYAGWSSNQGLTYYSASGAWSPIGCPASTDSPPYSSEDWKPEYANLPQWSPDVTALNEEKTQLDKYYKKNPSSKRFAGWVDDKYIATAPHGFNVWETNELCTYVKDGQSKTKCNGIDATMGCTMKFMTHEAGLYGSDNGNGANWHPTRAFHMLRGEAITWLYTLALLDGIYMVESDLANGLTPFELLTIYSKALDQLHPSMPDDYLPHYSKNLTLTDLIVGTHNWTYDDYEYPEWSKHYGYLDLKPVYISGPSSYHGEIFIKVTIGINDYVALCGERKESLKHTIIHVIPYANIPENKTEFIPPSNLTIWTKKKYFGNECKYILGLPVGIHVIGILPNSSHTDHITGLSHVIMWP